MEGDSKRVTFIGLHLSDAVKDWLHRRGTANADQALPSAEQHTVTFDGRDLGFSDPSADISGHQYKLSSPARSFWSERDCELEWEVDRPLQITMESVEASLGVSEQDHRASPLSCTCE